MKETELSKIISHALRHEPEKYNLFLSETGWVSIEELVKGIKANGDCSDLTSDDIVRVVNNAVKKRHEIQNGQIRAIYGHSVEIESKLVNQEPPVYLYHGTSIVSYAKIKDEGIKPMQRQYVHLSLSIDEATKVALRKSKDIIILKVEAARAYQSGTSFYSESPVWLTEYISPEYISPVESQVLI